MNLEAEKADTLNHVYKSKKTRVQTVHPGFGMEGTEVAVDHVGPQRG